MKVDSIEKGYFETNKPSIIDLYAKDDITYASIIDNINKKSIFSNIKISDIKDNILQVKVTYKDVIFDIYLKIMPNDNGDLRNINKVLVEDEKINLANHSRKYIKSYVAAKHEYVKAYYAQIKLLACLTNDPLLIIDCTQWCIYSNKYIQHILINDVDIIDSNLFKVKFTKDGCLYTNGLERFGIKDIEMNGIDSEYQKSCASFLSRLSCYFIENGQLPNTCTTYTEVFENPFYACIVDIEFALEELKKRRLINIKKRDETLNTNRLYVSVHMSEEMKSWYLNDVEVLKYLKDNTTYYASAKHFEDEKKLAQLTILKTIKFLMEIDDLTNLMILARKEDITTDWYYFSGLDNNKVILKTNHNSIAVDIKDIINWNYRGITPLYAYSLEI